MRISNLTRSSLLACAASFAFATPALADVNVGGFTFADNAFVDALTGSSGSYSTVGGSLSDVLTDIDEATFAFSFDDGAFLDLAFTDNFAVNGTGTDIVLFELGNVEDSWNVTINGITLLIASFDTGFDAGGFNLDAGLVDLTDFGIASGASISSLRLSFNPMGTVASTSLVGALNSINAIPEPATWAMMIGGFGMLGAAARRRTRARITYA